MTQESDQRRDVTCLGPVAQRMSQAERDVFFVELGGWDTHSNVLEVTSRNWEAVDAGLQDFVTELKSASLFNDVVIASASDFARSLTSLSLVLFVRSVYLMMESIEHFHEACKIN